MANATNTSGYWLNTDGYKNMDKNTQASIQKDYVNMNNNQKAGKFNGLGATDIASKYGLYTPQSSAQNIASVNQSHQDTLGKLKSGYFNDANNYKNLMNDEKYAVDLYNQTGDTTRWSGHKQTGTSPYDDLYKLFGIQPNDNLGNEGMYQAWQRQGNGFKANTMAGQAMGMTDTQGNSYGQGGGGSGGGGEFGDFLKMFMEMMMGGQGGQAQTQNKFQPLQYGDGVHLFKQEGAK